MLALQVRQQSGLYAALLWSAHIGDTSHRSPTSPCRSLPCRYGKLVQALKAPGRRFGHVQYAQPDSAAAALAALHQKLVGMGQQGMGGLRVGAGAVAATC